ncbi:MAG: hypothetical protein IEMM0008_0592 [bacterium]|nr:MAG: hypothetical protein IEMM0008_0592 [bacterium]
MSVDLLTKHPCFSKEASKHYGRIHLPVAKKCNISCNYCNRKYDCMNESRPGVTSEILSPESALERLKSAVKAFPYLSTIGIAGPGDSLANPDATFKTLELVKQEFPSFHLCLSTNGLMLADYANHLIDLEVGYITITINTINPKIAEKIYRRVRFKGVTYRGKEAAKLLLERQQEGLSKLAGKKTFIKINTLLIPGLNTQEQIEPVAKRVKRLGAHLVNVMPLIPAPGSIFEDYEGPGEEQINDVRLAIGHNIELMTHCRQCRSDAMGLLGENHCTKEIETNTCTPKLGLLNKLGSIK